MRIDWEPVHVGQVGFGRDFLEALLKIGWYGFCCRRPIEMVAWCTPPREGEERVKRAERFGLWLPALPGEDGPAEDEPQAPFLVSCRQMSSRLQFGQLVLYGQVDRIFRRGRRLPLATLDGACHTAAAGRS